MTNCDTPTSSHQKEGQHQDPEEQWKGKKCMYNYFNCIITNTVLFCFVLFSVQKCSSFSCYSLIWSIKTLVSHCQDFSYINNGFLALCVYIYNVFFSPVNEILSVTFDPNFLQMEDNPGT